MPFSSSFSYSLEHFRALWRHHAWRMTPASASAPSSSSSNVRKLMEVFFWKTDSFLYLTQRKTQSQLFFKEIRKKIQYSRISIWKKGKNGCLCGQNVAIGTEFEFISQKMVIYSLYYRKLIDFDLFQDTSTKIRLFGRKPIADTTVF